MGAAGGVETEWKQQSEKPVAGIPQGFERFGALSRAAWCEPPQQSPQRTVPARAGQTTPSARRARKRTAAERRPIIFSLYHHTALHKKGGAGLAPGSLRWKALALPS